MSKIVILGSGAAGISAAQTLRKENKDIEISMYSEENVLGYYTPQTIKYIEGNTKLEKLLIKPLEWYIDNKISMNLNKKVKRVNTDEKLVEFEDGTKENYEKLLIATGGRSVKLPINGAEKAGVFTFKTIEDVEKIMDYLKYVNRVCIIGAGFIGVEAAFSLRKLGKEVLIIEYAPKLLPKYLDDISAKKLSEELKKAGIDLRLLESVVNIEGQDKTERIELKSGEKIDCEMILMAVGIKPSLEYLKESGIACNKGIIVDENLRTNVQDVYAAGDIAELKGVCSGLWSTAQEHGKIVAKNILGVDEKVKETPTSFMMGAGNIKLFSMGIINKEKLEDEEQFIEDGEKFTKYVFRDGKVVGAVVINDPLKGNKIKKAILECITKKEILDKYM